MPIWGANPNANGSFREKGCKASTRAIQDVSYRRTRTNSLLNGAGPLLMNGSSLVRVAKIAA